MLNPNAQKWVDALRSGKYKQGRDMLAQKHGEDWKYCCLGVGCEVAVENGVELAVTQRGSVRRYDDGGAAPPPRVQEWLGLATADGRYYQSSLLIQNDEKLLSFPEIADIIESEPKGLFV